MKQPTILAFMQNPWFPPDTKKEHVDRYTTDQEFHRKILAKSMSGARLVTAFGHTLFNKIWWDNVCPTASDTPDGVGDPDMKHVERVIARQNPHLIIAFGKSAEGALDKSILATNIDYMCCHHPNARWKTAMDLAAFAADVAQWVELWQFKQNMTVAQKYEAWKRENKIEEQLEEKRFNERY